MNKNNISVYKMSPYQIHGGLQALVFFIILPIGALVALFRNWIGESWRPIHVAFQLTGVALFFVAISIAAYMGSKKPKDKETSTYRKSHKWIGRVLVLVILFQLIWAYQGRNWVEWNTWYIIHMALSMTILGLGWTNIYLATQKFQ